MISIFYVDWHLPELKHDEYTKPLLMRKPSNSRGKTQPPEITLN
jgi:hypothetical protein